MKDRPLAVCRELTKKYEEVYRGTARQLLELFLREPPRGEITLVISPLLHPEEKSVPDLKDESRKRLLEAMEKGDTPTEAVKNVAKSLSLKRNEVYKVLMELKRERGI